MDEKLKINLVKACGEYEFRLVEGSNEFVQLYAMLADFAIIGVGNENN
jgi:DNA polymerase III delta prime subunit